MLKLRINLLQATMTTSSIFDSRNHIREIPHSVTVIPSLTSEFKQEPNEQLTKLAFLGYVDYWKNIFLITYLVALFLTTIY